MTTVEGYARQARAYNSGTGIEKSMRQLAELSYSDPSRRASGSPARPTGANSTAQSLDTASFTTFLEAQERIANSQNRAAEELSRTVINALCNLPRATNRSMTPVDETLVEEMNEEEENLFYESLPRPWNCQPSKTGKIMTSDRF